ncbi:hypothetical protein ABLA30_21360 [Xenorhabdus nematophila]
MRILMATMLGVFISFSAHSKSIDDFFNKNTALRDDIFTKEAVYDQAMVYALADMRRVDPSSVASNKQLNEAMSKNGYTYALLGMRVLKSVCKDNDVMEINRLTEKECRIISSYQEK